MLSSRTYTHRWRAAGQARDSMGSLVYVYAVYDRYRRLRARVLCGSSGAGMKEILVVRASRQSAAKRLCLADTLWYGDLSRGDVRLGVIY